MQLIGMLDSPYVRRVAIVLLRLRLPFEHRPISLFRHIDEFRRFNPLLKAPTLITDDGTVLMDSTLIIQHLTSLTPDGAHLEPSSASDRLAALASLGLSLLVGEEQVKDKNQKYFEAVCTKIWEPHLMSMVQRPDFVSYQYSRRRYL